MKLEDCFCVRRFSLVKKDGLGGLARRGPGSTENDVLDAQPITRVHVLGVIAEIEMRSGGVGQVAREEVQVTGSGSGSGYGYGDGSGSGYGYGDGSGSGYGSGDGYGSGYGDGSGDGSGSGYGYGDGSGSGYGYGDGYGYGSGSGYGDGYGDGSGYGYGYGYGYGDGSGYGDGYGYPEQEIGGPSVALATFLSHEPRAVSIPLGDVITLAVAS